MTKKELLLQLDGIVPKNPKSEWSKYQRNIVNEAIKTIEQESILINKIEEEINSPNRDSCDFFIVDRIEEIINEHKTESEVKK